MASKPLWQKRIIHIDMDAFFAAIEQRDNPDLVGKPVIVGGAPDSRGVVATCSYEARKFGIHSAMSSAKAKRLCPNAIFVRSRISVYKEDSRKIMAILRQHTPLVSPVSLDEAYLNVTKHKLGIEDPVTIAKLIKQNIYAVTKLTASAGVAPNLFLAKVASDMNKPDGLTVVKPSEVSQFVSELPVRKIPGVGPVTEKQLKLLKIETCSDLVSKGEFFLTQRFGKTGRFLYARAQGIDYREVEPHSASKQYSTEETFSKDLLDLKTMQHELYLFSEEVFAGLTKKKRMGKTIVLKVKYHDFEVITRSKTLSKFPRSAEEVFKISCDLLVRKTKAGKKPVRLLGLGISNLEDLKEDKSYQERDLFEGIL